MLKTKIVGDWMVLWNTDHVWYTGYKVYRKGSGGGASGRILHRAKTLDEALAYIPKLEASWRRVDELVKNGQQDEIDPGVMLVGQNRG